MNTKKAPDLLFPDVLAERADRVSEEYSKGFETDTLDIDRVTLFVTHRCNFSCVYCNGPHLDRSMDRAKRTAMLRSDLTVESYVQMLADWSAHTVRAIHFTGGEPTLNPNLPEFVRLATERKIPSLVTTNGSADPRVYAELIQNGLLEIRVSIDSTDQSAFDRIVGVRGSYDRVLSNIHSMMEMKRQNADIPYVVLNACIGSFNLDSIKETLDSLMDFQTDAIKFLVVAEEKDGVRSEASREFVDDLLEHVRSRGRKDELLEHKIRAMFRRSSSGLACKSAQIEMERCFIPLTERTLDSQGIYPCSTYVRYKGVPIIASGASFLEQQEAINGFVANHDCRKDPICRDNCTSCCKQYNIEVNRRIRQGKSIQRAKANGVICAPEVSEEEMTLFRSRMEEIHSIGAQDGNPFVIIKPGGIPYRDEIRHYLAGEGLRFVQERWIDDWQAFSLYIYSKGRRDADPVYSIARNKAHRTVDIGNVAEYLLLEADVPEAKLKRIRTQLRHFFGEETAFAKIKDKIETIRTNCLHCPDYETLGWEKKVASYFFELSMKRCA